MDRRGFVAATGAAAAGAWAAPRGRRPNVLFLFTDDQREDTIGAFGCPYLETPNLDRLARRSTRLRNAYCLGGNSPAVCLPSRRMTLTGQGWFRLRDEPVPAANLPATFHAAGYQTWHLGKAGNVPRDIQRLFHRDRYVQDASRAEGFPGRAVADGVVGFLRGRDRSRPFLAYAAFETPHDPRVAPPAYHARYRPEAMPVPRNFLPFHPFDNGELLVRDEKLLPWPRTREAIQGEWRDYCAVMTYFDEQVGRILDTLREVGDEEDTIIVFASDQGIALGSHGLLGKQNLYEPSMAVPLLFAGPGVPEGTERDGFAYLLDIYPTLCELAGLEVPAGLQGRSQAGVIAGGPPARETIFLAYRQVQRAVRRGDWKLLRYPAIDRTQLFCLRDDPDEIADLAEDPAQAGRVGELLALLTTEQDAWGDEQPLQVSEPRRGEVDLAWYQAAQ